MAKKKEVKLYEIKDNMIIMKKSDIANLSPEDNTEIGFYAKTLGYEIVWNEEEAQTRNDFTVDKAKKYIKKNGSKEELKKFEELSKKAEKLAAEYKELKAAGSTDEAKAKQKEMLKESGNAFRSQKKWFKDTYGEDVYDQVRKYK